MLALLSLLLAGSAQAQSAAASSMSDPNKVVVIVDDAGDVGLRISDAQMVHETVITALRKRLGNDAVAYGGEKKNAATMKRMLGPNAETTLQDTRLVWFDAAEKAAPWRVRVKFGKKKNENWVTASCRKASDKPDAVVESKTGTGKTFIAARDDLAAQLPSFCMALPTAAAALPIEGSQNSSPNPTNPQGPPGMKKKEPTKAWTPPPRRD